MGIQKIKSGAFKFLATDQNIDKTAIAGTMIFSVDDDSIVTGDFRIHDGITPGGISVPPPGTISHMVPSRDLFEEEHIVANNGPMITVYEPDGVTVLYNGPDGVVSPYVFHLDWIPEANGVLVDIQLETETDLFELIRYGHDISTPTIQYPPIWDKDYPPDPSLKIYKIEYQDPGNPTTSNTKITLNDDVLPVLQEGNKLIFTYVKSEHGLLEKDGWFHCDGRLVQKIQYKALHNAIGDDWNAVARDVEVLDTGFDPSLWPFQDVVKYTADGFGSLEYVDYSDGRVKVFTLTVAEENNGDDYTLNSLGTDYTLGSDSTGSFIQFTSTPQINTKVVIIGIRDSQYFQIPDFRGYFLRCYSGGSSYPFGADSRQQYTLKKHSHYTAYWGDGWHNHTYNPWALFGYNPGAIAIHGKWGDREQTTNQMPIFGYKQQPSKNRAEDKVFFTNEHHHWYDGQRHEDWLNSIKNDTANADRVVYTLGQGPTDYLDPFDVENHQHYMKFYDAYIDYTMETMTPNDGPEAEVEIPHVKIPTFIKY